MENALAYAHKQQLLAKKLNRHHELFVKQLRPLRDEYENEFRRMMYRHNEAVDNKTIAERCICCFDLEQDYWKQLDSLFKKQTGLDVLRGEKTILVREV